MLYLYLPKSPNKSKTQTNHIKEILTPGETLKKGFCGDFRKLCDELEDAVLDKVEPDELQIV